MQIETTKLNDVLLIKPRVFRDDRGFFLESWNKRAFDEAVGRELHSQTASIVSEKDASEHGFSKIP